MERAQEYMEIKFLLRESVRTIACEIGTQISLGFKRVSHEIFQDLFFVCVSNITPQATDPRPKIFPQTGPNLPFHTAQALLSRT